MNFEIYLRALTLADARVSYKWRNNPKVWKYTNFHLSGQITHKIEERWLRDVLKKTDQKRFAICLKKDDRYIGNIQLTNIDGFSADFHLVIGDPEYWGKGIGQEATAIILDFAFFELCLSEVILTVDTDNKAAIAIYKKKGFVDAGQQNHHNVMRLTRASYLIKHSNYVI